MVAKPIRLGLLDRPSHWHRFLRVCQHGRPSENLFFAGEATHADWYGFIQGGYYSGLERANDIAGCIQGGKCQPFEPFTGLPVIVKTQDCKPKSKASQIAVLNDISLFTGPLFTWPFLLTCINVTR